MKKIIVLFSIFLAILTVQLPAEDNGVKLYLDPSYSPTGEDIRLTLDSFIDPGFPSPKNHLPVLFIHDNSCGEAESFRKHWQQSFNGWPSFRGALLLPENSRLGIEPYYIDLNDSNPGEATNQSLQDDAHKIKKAVELILFHQDDPAAKHKKVVIIAYGSGAVSARQYLKDLWENQNKNLSFHPVSELIAISPPNHGPLVNSQDSIEQLNDHSNRDAKKTNYNGQLFASEAPGSRRNYEPVEKGILYVTLYSEGEKEKRNLAPDAKNIEVSEIPSGNEIKSNRQYIVHMPIVICKALYTAVNHQAPPQGFSCGDLKKMDRNSTPIVPSYQLSKQEEGIVLLFDISGSMSRHLPVLKRAAADFLELSAKFLDPKTNIGMAIFPSLPWNRQTTCDSHAVFPMTPVGKSTIADAKSVLDCLTTQGETPLLNGLDTALHMFEGEKRKTIILFSDGNLNCPSDAYPGDPIMEKSIKALAEKKVKLYTIGLGSRLDRWTNGIDGLTVPTRCGPVAEATSIFAQVLGLEKVKDAGNDKVVTRSALKMNICFDKNAYRTGDTITFTAAVADGKRPVSGVTRMTVKVSRPVVGPGNWYAANDTLPSEWNSVAEKYGGDSLSLLQRKVLSITKNPRASLPKMTGPKLVDLYDDGTHGDEKKADGIYTNQYTDTVKEGVYSFQFSAFGDKFEMEKRVQTYVSVYPDPSYSAPVIRWRDSFNDQMVYYAYDIEFIPRDRFGNYLGPQHTVDVKILYRQEEENSHSITLQNNLDGTYNGEINLSRSGLKTGVRLVFMIDGKPVTHIEKIPRFKTWSFGVSAAGNFPDNFSRNYTSPGISVGCTTGYRFSPQFSVVGLLGYNRFRSRSYSSIPSEKQWWNISVNLKSEILKDPFRVFFNAGFGLYITEGGDIKRGSNAGAGGAYSLKPGWVLEVGADLHRVYLEGVDSDFMVTYVRLVHRF